MIVAQDRLLQREIFQSIRSSVQELHDDKIILEDVNGAPFLFKSHDAQVWARIFFRSMRDFSVFELQHEIKKLWMLMPNDAVLYLFFPELDRQQIFQMNGFSDRLSFFEYAGLGALEKEGVGVKICKWIPSSAYVPAPPQERSRHRGQTPESRLLQSACLTPGEIADLVELSLVLRGI